MRWSGRCSRIVGSVWLLAVAAAPITPCLRRRLWVWCRCSPRLGLAVRGPRVGPPWPVSSFMRATVVGCGGGPAAAPQFRCRRAWRRAPVLSWPEPRRVGGVFRLARFARVAIGRALRSAAWIAGGGVPGGVFARCFALAGGGSVGAAGRVRGVGAGLALGTGSGELGVEFTGRCGWSSCWSWPGRLRPRWPTWWANRSGGSGMAHEKNALCARPAISPTLYSMRVLRLRRWKRRSESSDRAHKRVPSDA